MSWARRLGLIVFGVLLAVAVLSAAELLLRVADRGVRGDSAVRFEGAVPEGARLTKWDRDLLFRLRGSAEFLGYYRTNSRGYRGHEFPDRRGGAFRVVCVGDSCTFGLGVPEEQAWPERLRRALFALFEDVAEVEVLNLGVPGYSSFQNRRQIETEVRELEPDLVVFFPTGYNDANDNQGATDEERAARNKTLLAALGRLRLARLLGAKPARPPYGEGSGLAAAREGASDRVPLERFLAQLELAARACDDMDARLVVVAPRLGDALLALDPGLARRTGIVRAFDRAAVADVAPRFDALAPWRLLRDDLHPNADGHALIAREVLSVLVERSYLPDAPERVAFARAFFRALEHGIPALDAEQRSALLQGAPTRVRTRLDSILAGANGHKGEAGFLDHDPLVGGDRDPYAPGALWVRALSSGDPGELEKAREVDRHAVPRGVFRSLLFGAREPFPPDPSDLALARALFVLDVEMDARGPRLDRAILDALRALERGDAAAALELSDQALSRLPGRREARLVRVRALSALSRHKEAMEQALALAREFPADPDVRILAGTMLFARGRLDQAREHLVAGLERDPVDPEGLYLLARIELKNDRLEEAEHLTRSALAIDGSRVPDAPRLLMEILRRREGGESQEPPG